MNIFRLLIVSSVFVFISSVVAASSVRKELKACLMGLEEMGYKQKGKSIVQKPKNAAFQKTTMLFLKTHGGQEFVARVTSARFDSKRAVYDWNIEHAVTGLLFDTKDVDQVFRGSFTNGEAAKQLRQVIGSLDQENIFGIDFFEGNTDQQSTLIVRVHKNAKLIQKTFPKFRGFNVYVENIEKFIADIKVPENKAITAALRKKVDPKLLGSLMLYREDSSGAPKILPVLVFGKGSRNGRSMFLKASEILALGSVDEVKYLAYDESYR